MIYSTGPLRKLRLTQSTAMGYRAVQDTCAKSTLITGPLPACRGYAKRDIWSNSISYSSPESDFTSRLSNISPPDQKLSPTREKVEYGKRNLWSNSISFSSPESDFTSLTFPNLQKKSYEKFESNENKWSGCLSFSSPESDFTTNMKHNGNKNEENLQAFTPKADFIDHIQNSQYHRDSMAYSLSFAGAESDFCSSTFQNLLDNRMKRQLENVTKQSLKRQKDLEVASRTNFVNENHDLHVASVPSEREVELHEAQLPRTYASATKSDDPRAIVVTEASKPFRIVSVNAAWEQLCGFSAAECHGKTLECLQGPDTDYQAINALMAQLKDGEEAGTVLTNYTKTGRKFQNRLRVGPLTNDNDKVTHVIGILTEVMETGHQFSDGGQHINKMNV